MFDNFKTKKTIKSIKEKFAYLPDVLVKKIGFLLLFLFLLSLLITFFLFQKYYLQIKDKEFKEHTPSLNEQVLEDILEEWQKRERTLEGFENKNYPELFEEKISPVDFEESEE
jgi:hypothetical protein